MHGYYTNTYQLVLCFAFHFDKRRKKYRAVTNFIVEMKSLNGNLAIFHMQNKSEKLYMAQANAMAMARSVCIENSALLHSVRADKRHSMRMPTYVCKWMNVLGAV